MGYTNMKNVLEILASNSYLSLHLQTNAVKQKASSCSLTLAKSANHIPCVFSSRRKSSRQLGGRRAMSSTRRINSRQNVHAGLPDDKRRLWKKTNWPPNCHSTPNPVTKS